MAEPRDKDKHAFLARWSKRKLDSREAQETDAPKPAAAPAEKAGARIADQGAPGQSPQLPPLEDIGFDADFRAFMNPEVDEALRRAALKKLFADARFNVMDGLDSYTEDWTQAETISAEMLATLEHAKHTLFGPRPEEKEAAQDSSASPAAATQAPEVPREEARKEAHEEAAPKSAADGDTNRKPEGEDGAAG